jgi:hypothetical protein
VLAGVAGVGKTRLAVEALALAERHGFAAVRATATNTARGIPFGAVATFLPLSTRSPTVNDRAAMIQRMSRAGSSAWHPGARPCWSTMPTSSIRKGHSSDSLFAARLVTLEGLEIGCRILFHCDTGKLANAHRVCEDRLIVLWAS